MLNGTHLVDFGNHRNTRLTFGRMTALVGQNGSGKTTVMRALREVALAAKYVAKTTVDERYVRCGSQRAIVLAGWTENTSDERTDWGLELSNSAQWFRRRYPAGADARAWIPQLRLSEVRKETATVSLLERLEASLKEPRTPPQPTKPGEIESMRDWYRRFCWTCRYFKTSARSLQDPAKADDESPSINDDGSNLAWALSYLMTAEPERFGRIVEALREVVPVVKRIRSRPTKLTQFEKRTITINKQDRTFDEEREVMGQELIFDMASGSGLPAAAVSEGTLVTLAILTLVHGSDADLIMLDDVELGLHPKAQRDLIRQLRRIQETHPKLQILVSTHSPYVVDEFKAEDVWVFAPDKEGCAVAKRLSDHPDAKRALEVLTTGEFWSAEGEPWVLNDEEPVARVAEEPHA